nr:hypothetical protein [uncultured Pseudomonas sp.]
MKRPSEDLQLGSIELFCLYAEASSFSAAVSRSICRLTAGGRSRPFTLLYPHGR